MKATFPLVLAACMVTAVASISITAWNSAEFYEAEFKAQEDRVHKIKWEFIAEQRELMEASKVISAELTDLKFRNEEAAYAAAHPIVKYLPARRGRKWVVEQWTVHPKFGFVIVGIFNTEEAAKLYADQLSNPQTTIPK